MQALVLAGGSGTRFWPLSRRLRPKQLLALDGGRSLLQATIDRLAPTIEPAGVWICTTERLADLVRGQLPEVPAAQVLAEPSGRNTAPAIAWALDQMPDEVRRGVVAVLPADHRMADDCAFREALAAAADEAETADRVMTLGVLPTRAETGYGYLELGPSLEPAGMGGLELRRVARFTEKPDAERAAAWVEAGSHLWNAGIFVFRGETLADAVRRLEPAIGEGLELMRREPERAGEIYGDLPSVSIDVAVMERLDDLATLPLDCGWNDLGSWQALADVVPADGAGNHSRGDTLAVRASGNVLFADEGTIAVVGVDGLVVVRTGDAVLVVPVDAAQEVKQAVEALAAAGRDDLL